MKTRLILSLFLLASSLPVYPQLLLNEGATWSYDFSSLPHQGYVPAIGVNPSGRFEFRLNSASLGEGDRLLYEMFENSTSESPIFSGALDTPRELVSSMVDYAWQDAQGAVRFTMQSGSVIVDTITLETLLAGPSLSSYEVRSDTFVPIPEPGTFGLLAASLVLGGLMLRRRR